MWIVRLALRRPYTFVVTALLLLLLTPFVRVCTPVRRCPPISLQGMAVASEAESRPQVCAVFRV
jgi:hypothetical protein